MIKENSAMAARVLICMASGSVPLNKACVWQMTESPDQPSAAEARASARG